MNQTTEQLEKNELVDWAQKRFGHMSDHLPKLYLGVILGIIAAFGLIYYFYLQNELKASEWRNLSAAIYGMQATGSTDEFKQLSETGLADSKVTQWGMLLAADTQLRKGLATLISDRPNALKELKKAKTSLESIVTSKNFDPKKVTGPMITERALYSLAYTCESLGEFDEAKKYYTQLVETLPKSPFVKQANRALDRLADPQIKAIFQQFTTVGVAPESPLPTRPDISFPEDFLTDPPATTPESAPAAETPAVNPPAAESGSEPKKSEGDKMEGEGQAKKEEATGGNNESPPVTGGGN